MGVPPQRDVSIQAWSCSSYRQHRDERGSLTETFRRDRIPGARDMVQANVSRSRAGVGLYIPPAVAHGFYAETDVVLQYLVDRGYTGDDEFGLAWNDPDVGIDWPDPSPRLSDRDLSDPRLGELESLMSSRTPG